MNPKRFCIYSFLLSSILWSSCTNFRFEKLDRNEIKKVQLNEIRKKSLKNYPEIYSCEAQEDPKICFERQLNEHLGSHLAGVVVDEDEITKDTIWLTVHVSRTGELSLKPIQNFTEEYQYLYDTIQKSLEDISPIKPAYINGVTVNCNFKLPLVIKNIE